MSEAAQYTVKPDSPKSLAHPNERAHRLALIKAPHVAPLNEMVEALRDEFGPQYQIPYFDPLDGGTSAECLFLLEAPGPKAIASGFISRNNPDETARNFFLLNQQAGIDRRRTVTWNVVPWYVGTGTKIRAANAADVRSAGAALSTLLGLLPQLRVVALVGAKAQRVREAISPTVQVFAMPHPSPMFVNRAPGNRERILAVLREVASEVGARSAAN